MVQRGLHGGTGWRVGLNEMMIVVVWSDGWWWGGGGLVMGHLHFYFPSAYSGC